MGELIYYRRVAMRGTDNMVGAIIGISENELTLLPEPYGKEQAMKVAKRQIVWADRAVFSFEDDPEQTLYTTRVRKPDAI